MPDGYDLVILGGGPGGYVAAIRAAQLGMKTAVVERDELGGICLNWGCIPTKALLRTSEIYHLMHRLGDYGFSAEKISFDPAKVVARSRAVAKQLSNGVGFLLRKNKITVVMGEGRARRQGQGRGRQGRQAGRRSCRQAHYPLATGARARALRAARARTRTATWCGPTRRRWCRRRCRNRCW